MFSRDDYGRNRAHPLLWVFGPLVLGALIITGIGIAARATQGFPNIELAADLETAAGDHPLLAEATPFEWDRVCISPPNATADDVDELLGFEWGVIGGDPLEQQRPLLVFVEGEEVVTHLWLRRGVLDDPPSGGVCLGPDDEATRL